jgi:hypothetical protein
MDSSSTAGAAATEATSSSKSHADHDSRLLRLPVDEHKEDDSSTMLMMEQLEISDHPPPHAASAAKLIGSPTLAENVSCPCCRQPVENLKAQTLNEPLFCRPGPVLKKEKLGNLLDEELAEDETKEDCLPGVLAEGVNYYPTRILVEGWLHKKGTGNDWIYSRGWKSRWTRLCWARVDGYATDVPLLLIYWFPTSDEPSTVILLDHTVVLKVDKEDKSYWNSYRFDVRHIAKDGKTTPVTRTFSAPPAARDAWAFAISDVLLTFEKEKQRAKRTAATRDMHQARLATMAQRKSPIMDDAWIDEHLASSPPSSPVSFPKTFSSSCSSPRLPRPEAKKKSSAVSRNLSAHPTW